MDLHGLLGHHVLLGRRISRNAVKAYQGANALAEAKERACVNYRITILQLEFLLHHGKTNMPINFDRSQPPTHSRQGGGL